MPDALALPASLPLADDPSPCEELPHLRHVLRCPARLLVKRDDSIAFAFGGNKVRKLRFVAAQAKASGADTLITTGSVQSNHARVTAAVAAKLGMKCILVVNGVRPVHPTGNALLDQLLGAEMRYVIGREDRPVEMQRAADDTRARGGVPFVIPLGASTPLGAVAFVAAIDELGRQIDPPDVIIQPRMPAFGLFDFHRAEALIECGAAATKREIEDIKFEIAARRGDAAVVAGMA